MKHRRYIPVVDEEQDEAVLNSNPEGCNQYTGPGCAASPPAKPTIDEFQEWSDKGWSWGDNGWEPPQEAQHSAASSTVDQSVHDAARLHLSDDAKQLIASSHSWEKSRPWNASEAEIRAGAVPGIAVGSYGGRDKEVAHYENGKIVLSSKFYQPPMANHEEARQHVLYHELGHQLADTMVNDGTSFQLHDAGVIPARHDLGSGTGGGHGDEEALADAYALLHTDLPWLRKNHPQLEKPVADRARALGMPLPKGYVANARRDESVYRPGGSILFRNQPPGGGGSGLRPEQGRLVDVGLSGQVRQAGQDGQTDGDLWGVDYDQIAGTGPTVNPFVSEAQRRWMHANEPEMAERWEAHTPKSKQLPRKVRRRAGVRNARSVSARKAQAGLVEEIGSPNPLRADPCAIPTLRRLAAADLRGRFEELARRVAAWCQQQPDDPTSNLRWVGNSNPEGCNQFTGPGCSAGAAKLTQDSFKEGDADTTGRVMDLAASRIAERWDVSDEDLAELAKADGATYQTKEEAAWGILKEWSGSAGGPIPTAASVAVARDLGDQVDFYGDTQRGRQAYIDAHPALARATASLGRAMYQVTQDWLRARGIKELTLVRSGGHANSRSAASWSLGIGGVRDASRNLVSERIPADRILSVPSTGFGTLAEMEVVVLPRRHVNAVPIANRSIDALRAAVDAAAAEAHPAPTEAQREAGNYAKGHVTVQGLPITIETAAGRKRKPSHSRPVAWHYGYIKRTESAADGDHVDVFLGPDLTSEVVFVVDQVKHDGHVSGADGPFDEHKCLVGWTNAADAKAAYLASYGPGWRGFGGIRALTMAQFKQWLASGDTGRPIVGQQIVTANANPEGCNQHTGPHCAATPEEKDQNAKTPTDDEKKEFINLAKDLTKQLEESDELSFAHSKLEQYQQGVLKHHEGMLDELARGGFDRDKGGPSFNPDNLAERVRAHFQPARDMMRRIYGGDTVVMYRGTDPVGGVPGKKLTSYALTEEIARKFQHEGRVLKRAAIPINAIYMVARTADRPLEIIVDNDRLPRHLATNAASLRADPRTLSWEERQRPAANAFCPGEGAKDNSCSSAHSHSLKEVKERMREPWTPELGQYKQYNGAERTPEQDEAAKKYGYVVASQRVNRALRGLEQPDAETQAVIGHLDAAMASSNLPGDVVTYRGLTTTKPLEEGDVLDHQGYVSTTLDDRFALRHADNVAAGRDTGAGRVGEVGGVPQVIKLLMPKGSRVTTGAQSALEIIADRGSRIRIVGRTKKHALGVLEQSDRPTGNATSLGKESWTSMPPGWQRPSIQAGGSGQPRDEQGRFASVGASQLAEGGWATKDYHDRWLKEGAAKILEVPIDQLVPRKGEPLEGVEEQAPDKIAGMKQVWTEGARHYVPEGYVDSQTGQVHVTDGRHRIAAQRSRGRSTVPIIVANQQCQDTPILEVPDKRQPDNFSCGAAASFAVGEYLGIGPRTIDAWKDRLHTTLEHSTDPRRIVQLFREQGAQVEARSGMTVDDLAASVRRGMPVICCVQDYGDRREPGASFLYGHYLTVIGVVGRPGSRYVICQDSSIENACLQPGGDVPRAQEAERTIDAPGRIMVREDKWLEVWHDQDKDGNKYVRWGCAVGRAGVANAFCATGEGGGIDPTCSPMHSSITARPGDKGLEKLLASLSSGVPTGNAADPSALVAAFRRWLDGQLGQLFPEQDPRLDEWAGRAYLAGATAAFDDVQGGLDGQARAGALHQYLWHLRQYRVPEAAPAGNARHDVRDLAGKFISQPVKLLAQRLHGEVKGLTARVSQDAARVLADGLAKGYRPRHVAIQLNKVVEGGFKHALRIAHTELSRARNSGFLDGASNLGAGHVGAMVELENGEDPCPACAALDGAVYPVDAARGMLPMHPFCACAWRAVGGLPVGNRWLLANAFCPTGPGGGVNPHCSPGGVGVAAGGAGGPVHKRTGLPVGLTVAKTYRGVTYRVEVMATGFQLTDPLGVTTHHQSLSAVINHMTKPAVISTSIWKFFGLTKPVRGQASAAVASPASATPPTAPAGLASTIPFQAETSWQTGQPQSGQVLDGIPFEKAPYHFWEHVKDVDVDEPKPLRPVIRVGIMIRERDGRIWVVEPTNHFGDRQHTLPGGHAEPGLTNQQNALKEVWEETGLQVKITGHLGDFTDSNNGNNGRLYLGERIGGAPWDAKIEASIISRKTGWPAAESETVKLVTPERAAQLLHRTDDLAQLATVHPIKVDAKRDGNMMKKLVEGLQPAAKAYEKAMGGQSAGDSTLHAVQDLRGFNGKPTVMSKADMDALVAKGDHIEMMRGLQDRGGTTAKEMAEQFRTGIHYPGFGCFGSGTYFDASKGYNNVATSQYVGYGGSGAVIRAALPKTAKIIQQSELEKQAWGCPSNYPNKDSHSDERSWQGLQAALAGYDAIHIDGKSTKQDGYGNRFHSATGGFYVILNRSILAVQKEDAKGHTIT